MPSLTPEELSEARRRSGRLGGRPSRPTVAEARAKMLEELVPRALEVLEGNLGSGDERVRQRAAEHVLDRAWGRPVARVEGRMATVADELDELSAGELEELAARALAFLDGVGGPQEGR